MGKYMRKTKANGGVAIMEMNPHAQSQSSSSTASSSHLGVRTRAAKTLALQRLQNSSASAAAAAGGSSGGSGGSYLQLRSRRLEKPPQPPAPVDNGKRVKQQAKESAARGGNSSKLIKAGPASEDEKEKVEEKEGMQKAEAVEEKKAGGVLETEEETNSLGGGGAGEASFFGENLLDLEGRDRMTRETTPCSLIRDPDNIRTPGSSTKPSSGNASKSRVPSATRRGIPTAHDVDEIFVGVEEQERQKFIEKYNFDPATEKPLPGRYEWVKVDP